MKVAHSMSSRLGFLEGQTGDAGSTRGLGAAGDDEFSRAQGKPEAIRGATQSSHLVVSTQVARKS
jgi:hypothetical protein